MISHYLIRYLLLLVLLSSGLPSASFGQDIENVLLITMDGLRWQELFYGAEKRLIDKESGKVKNLESTRNKYWHEDPKQRRELLMPHFWKRFGQEGQIFGSPDHQSKVTVSNTQLFSYPGYNELLCGFADPKIDSNDKNYNRNTTVLEWLNRKPGFQGRVAAFCSWDVFPYIINDKRSGVYVNAGWRPLDFFENESIGSAYAEIHRNLPHFWDNVRYDAFTFRGAYEYIKIKKPRVLYVALGETDDWAHEGRYDLYLDSAKMNDRLIHELWQLIQTIETYKNKTALVLSTDHGRGDGREGWKNHNDEWPGSDKIWIAMVGPGIKGLGFRSDTVGTQAQIAATVARLLGFDFTTHHPSIAKPIQWIEE